MVSIFFLETMIDEMKDENDLQFIFPSNNWISYLCVHTFGQSSEILAEMNRLIYHTNSNFASPLERHTHRLPVTDRWPIWSHKNTINWISFDSTVRWDWKFKTNRSPVIARNQNAKYMIANYTWWFLGHKRNVDAKRRFRIERIFYIFPVDQ